MRLSIRFRKLRSQILIIFLLAFITILSISGNLFYRTYRNVLLDRIQDNLKVLTYQNKVNLETMITGINQATVYLFTDKTIADILFSRPLDSIDLINKRRALNDQFRHYMNAPITSSITSYSAQLFVNDQLPFSEYLNPAVYASQIESSTGVFHSDGESGKPWYEETLSRNGGLHSFVDPDDKFRIYVSRHIRNQYIEKMKAGTELGVVRIGINKHIFGRYLDSSKMTEGTRVLLYSEEGSLLYGNLSRDELPLADHIAQELEGREGVSDYRDSSGSYMAGVYTLSWGWRFISLIPYEDILIELKPIRRLALIITVSGCLIAFVLAVLLAGTISKPITELAETMHEIKSTENINIQLNYFHCDEVGELYHSFNQLLRRIDKLLSEVSTGKEREKIAELKALQAQINPHFIYNTLDSVGWLSLERKQDDIASMVSLLADIMRYSIKDYDQMVSLKDELTHIQNYLSIQSFRFGSITELELEIPVHYNQMKVPKFIIQPLVENALLHGLDGCEKGSGKIRISLEEGESSLILRVDDNGKGCNAGTLNNYLRGENPELIDSDGFGIKNVHERLRLHYGLSAGLIYQSLSGEGTSALIVIPKEMTP